MVSLSVEEALRLILEDIEETNTQYLTLPDADQRILAEDLRSTLTNPPFDTSAMDGYAVHKEDILRLPVQLKIIGESKAGSSFTGKINPGECVRIFTGAPLPYGASHVVIQEDTYKSNDIIEIKKIHSSSSNIRERGGDFSEGNILLKKGHKLDARALMLAAAMGHPVLPVRRKPTVAILATGDELVEPGKKPQPDQIIASNSYGLLSLINTSGGHGHLLGIAEDKDEVLKKKFLDADRADVVVTSGGVSVGDYDRVGPTLLSLGVEIKFWNIAMRPGKPMLFGQRGKQKILGLPGNPISSLICGRIFLVPLIHKLLGHINSSLLTLQAQLTHPLDENGPRRHYMRATITKDSEGQMFVTPQKSQDSSLVYQFAKADALIVREAHASKVLAKTNIEILPLDF